MLSGFARNVSDNSSSNASVPVAAVPCVSVVPVTCVLSVVSSVSSASCGGIGGIAGMLLAVPVTATLYRLLRADVHRRRQDHELTSV